MSGGVLLLFAAQFLSGLADNALLVVTIARLLELHEAAWLAPMLKLFFTVAYVVLAPFVAALADRWPKGRVMLYSNLLKGLACAGILCGIDPLVAFALAGFGAACYSPAKYGLVTELVPADALVRANGVLEVTTVSAIILGTVLGGILASPGFTAWPILDAVDRAMPISTQLGPGMLAVLALYLLAGAVNLAMPQGVARTAHAPWQAIALVRRFVHANTTLWRDPLGGMSLAVTTVFWGAGATLQFVVLAWACSSLKLGLDQAAYLQGVVAAGITLGAAAAGRCVSLRHAPRVLPLGILMGLSVPLLLLVKTVALAIPLLATVGALAGFFLVPMNALLQHRGLLLLHPGESIAVQNFNENLCVLAMLAAYSSLVASRWPLHALVFAFGGLVAACVTWVMLRQRAADATVSTP
ncbi:MAG TPA: lysophospholipid transporter LplT [Ramlibacter sp.]|uniref:lysophospholipid transporter LplT n=1 Tax=Ramlibacter sp. TaxID=1917967 RepID=UPI002CB9683C|nr:lysophospholipid transporter LplT [Ramlibacter sp.]HVZ43152.1 lysophospholipid transporter LplT [Ramlibacter sp.]